MGVLRKPFAITDLLQALDRVKPRGMVLVADDDPDFAASLKPILTRHGYRVEIASTGQEALAKATAADIDCLVLDLSMPLLTGVEVHRKLVEAGRAIPTIFVTGGSRDQDTLRAQLQRPDNGVLLKPFDPDALLLAIAAATGAAPSATDG